MTLTLHVPTSTLRALGERPEAEVRLAAALKLYELGRLSAQDAAELSGLNREELATLALTAIDSAEPVSIGPAFTAAEESMHRRRVDDVVSGRVLSLSLDEVLHK